MSRTTIDAPTTHRPPASPPATAQPHHAPAEPPDRRKWLALAVLMAAEFMNLVDATIVNVALPSIQRDLGASFSAVQWVTGGYALAFAAMLVTGGRLGDLVGRRRLFLMGLAGFTAASVACGLATGAAWLVTARLAQGGAAAMMVPQVLSIMNVSFTSEERGKVFGLLGGIVGLGAVSGPLLGAVLTEADILGLGWRPIFLVNLPVGLIAIWLGRRWVDESRADRPLRLDPVGVALAVTAVGLLLYPLTTGEQAGWPAYDFAMMAAAPVLLAVFVWYERGKDRRDGSPLVDLGLFRIATFAAGLGVQLLFGIVMGIFFLVWTLYMQQGLGWSPLHAGLTVVPFSVAMAVAATCSVQVLVPRFGRRVLHAGVVSMLVGIGGYVVVIESYGAGLTTWGMTLPLVLMGAGMGLIVAPLMNVILSQVPSEYSGSASGLTNTTNQLGFALGLGLVSVAFVRFLYPVHDAAVVPDMYGGAFEHGLAWVCGALLLAAAAMFALPRAAGHQ
ncbi:MAG: MFS transporter [Nocardioidaceae bacterium]